MKLDNPQLLKLVAFLLNVGFRSVGSGDSIVPVRRAVPMVPLFRWIPLFRRVPLFLWVPLARYSVGSVVPLGFAVPLVPLFRWFPLFPWVPLFHWIHWCPLFCWVPLFRWVPLFPLVPLFIQIDLNPSRRQNSTTQYKKEKGSAAEAVACKSGHRALVAREGP